MGRYRSRSRSYSPRRSRTPPRRRHYDESPRSRRSRRSPAPSGLLVRNISLDARPEDLRIPFERYGPVKDVYLPKNYYTGEPRGFGFVKFRNPDDAAEAKRHLNHTVIGGREIAIVFAEENRKTPQEMRIKTRVSGRSGGSYRRRSPYRSPRQRYRSYSRSPTPVRRYSRDRERRGKGDYSRSRSWSASPDEARASRRSSYRSPSVREDDRSPRDTKEHWSDRRSPTSSRDDGGSPRDRRGRRMERSPRENGRSLSPSPSPRSRSYSH